MTPHPKVISLEFNELCPNLMAKFIAAGELPRFQQFRAEAEVFETDAEESGELLNPWVQWVTVHTGLSAREHGVTALSEGHRVAAPAVWDALSAAGRRVWVCGSMNSRYDAPLDGCLIPDPWSTGVPSYPAAEFDPYLNYVRSAVQEHTGGGGTGGMKSFLRYMAGHGLSAGTVLAAAAQLASERLGNTRWKRACLLDRFQWDLFRHYYRKLRPDFATFFLNSTAHLQHCYWRNMEPERFATRPGADEQRDYAGAILHGYKSMDRLVGRFLRLAGADATLVFSTALSQQPYLDHDETGGRHYYHLRDQSVLVKLLGLPEAFAYEPVMAEQFYLRFASKEEADRAEAYLLRFHVKHPAVFSHERTQLFHIARKGDALLAQCRCTARVPADARITAPDDPAVSVPFADAFYLMDAKKSGRHHPAGMLWVRHPDRRHRVHDEKVSLRTVAPLLLRLSGLPEAPAREPGRVASRPEPVAPAR